jgi:hypothetical protein
VDRLAPDGDAVPVPVKLAIWGLLLALSVTVRVPEAAPAAVGEKVTAIVQVPLAATGVELEQVVPAVARLKGAVTIIEVMVRLLAPLLVSVMGCALLVVPTAWAAKADGVDRLAPDEDGVPVPVRLAIWGLLLALSVTVRLPAAAPVAVGVNVTAIAQVPPLAATGNELEQVVPAVARPKGLVTTIAVMVRLLEPVLVSVIGCALLVVPTIWAGKGDGVDRLAPDEDAVPVPLTLTVCVLGRPPLLSVIVTVPAWAPTVVGSKVTAIVQLLLAATVPPV